MRTVNGFNGFGGFSKIAEAIASVHQPTKPAIFKITSSHTTTPIMSKPKKEPKLKEWPKDPTALINYNDIVNPLKDIISQGYRLFRKDAKDFKYCGYNIGSNELNISPPPQYRFAEEFLAADTKVGKRLIDAVLHILFLLGVEQGRRAERKEAKSIDLIIETMDKYREENKDLRLRIDELELRAELKDLSGEKLEQALQEGLKDRRLKRIQQAKKELGMDPVRSSFEFKNKHRARFKELELLAKTFETTHCTNDQWADVLKEKGWTITEWSKKCKKKSLTTRFA